jgi:pimeloyl-ACP methyl ester carboxylesterase
MHVVIDDSLTMHYKDDTFAPPWLEPQVVLLIHGGAESADAWFGWMPHLVRRFRVIRLDLRGHGRSSVPDDDFQWSLEALAADLLRFLDELRIDRVHVVGAKFGGTIGLYFAWSAAERVRTIAALGSPVSHFDTGGAIDVRAEIGAGPETYLQRLQQQRMGSGLSDDEARWWERLHDATRPSVRKGLLELASRTDLSGLLPQISAPLIFVTTDGNPLISVDRFARWRAMAPKAEMSVLVGDGFHVAATHPAECSRQVVDFINRHADD